MPRILDKNLSRISEASGIVEMGGMNYQKAGLHTTSVMLPA
jgi:hypothetical protein